MEILGKCSLPLRKLQPTLCGGWIHLQASESVSLHNYFLLSLSLQLS